jgi:hypothetical protein
MTYIDNDGRYRLRDLIFPTMIAGHGGPRCIRDERVRRHNRIIFCRRCPIDVVSRTPAVRLVVILHSHYIFYARHRRMNNAFAVLELLDKIDSTIMHRAKKSNLRLLISFRM